MQGQIMLQPWQNSELDLDVASCDFSYHLQFGTLLKEQVPNATSIADLHFPSGSSERRIASLIGMDSISVAEHHGRLVSRAHPLSYSTHPPPISPHGFSIFNSSIFLESDGGLKVPLSLPIQGGAYRRSNAGCIPGVPSAWHSDSRSSPDGEVELKKSSRRRLPSDSVPFADNSYQVMSHLENVTEEDESILQAKAPSTCKPNHRKGSSANNDSGHHSLQCEVFSNQWSCSEKGARGSHSTSGENFCKIRDDEPCRRHHRQENLAACNREGLNFVKSGSLEVSWDSEKAEKQTTLTISSSKTDGWLASRGKALNWSALNCENHPTASGGDSYDDGCNETRHDKSYERFRTESKARLEEDVDCSAQLHYNCAGSDQVDLKTAQRIRANKQSAQRSRIRKSHFISELESNVGKLKAEIASLSPKVEYYQHERVLLNLENVILRQKLAALTKAQRLKEALKEILKTEVQRLRELYDKEKLQHHSQHPQQRPLFLDVLDLHLLEFSMLHLGPSTTKTKSPSAFEGVKSSSNRPSSCPTKVISYIHAQDSNDIDIPLSHAAK